MKAGNCFSVLQCEDCKFCYSEIQESKFSLCFVSWGMESKAGESLLCLLLQLIHFWVLWGVLVYSPLGWIFIQVFSVLQHFRHSNFLHCFWGQSFCYSHLKTDKQTSKASNPISICAMPFSFIHECIPKLREKYILCPIISFLDMENVSTTISKRYIMRIFFFFK